MYVFYAWQCGGCSGRLGKRSGRPPAAKKGWGRGAVFSWGILWPPHSVLLSVFRPAGCVVLAVSDVCVGLGLPPPVFANRNAIKAHEAHDMAEYKNAVRLNQLLHLRAAIPELPQPPAAH